MSTEQRTGNKQPANDPALKEAVHEAGKEAEHTASTGNVATAKETTAQPAESLGVNVNVDLPTGARSHPTE